MSPFVGGCTTREDNRHTVEKEKNLYPLTKLPDLTIYPSLALQQGRQLTYHKRIHALSF